MQITSGHGLDTLGTTPATRLGSGGTTLIAPASAAMQAATTRSSTLLYARPAFLFIPLGSLTTSPTTGRSASSSSPPRPSPSATRARRSTTRRATRASPRACRTTSSQVSSSRSRTTAPTWSRAGRASGAGRAPSTRGSSRSRCVLAWPRNCPTPPLPPGQPLITEPLLSVLVAAVLCWAGHQTWFPP